MCRNVASLLDQLIVTHSFTHRHHFYRSDWLEKRNFESFSFSENEDLFFNVNKCVDALLNEREEFEWEIFDQFVLTYNAKEIIPRVSIVRRWANRFPFFVCWTLFLRSRVNLFIESSEDSWRKVCWMVVDLTACSFRWISCSQCYFIDIQETFLR